MASAAGHSRRGHNRERQVRDLLANEDWLAFRAPASLGVADVVALRDGSRPRLIEVKSTAAGPYHGFLPADRARLSLAAKLAGADAFLVWWPSRGKPVWIAENEWPIARTASTDGADLIHAGRAADDLTDASAA